MIDRLKNIVSRNVEKAKGKGVVKLNTKRLQFFAEDNHDLNLYHKGIEIANSGKRNTFLKQCRYLSLTQLLRKVLNDQISGDIAECGCFKGHSSYIIASILNEFKADKEFHIFDSFEGGLSNRGIKDTSPVKRTEKQLEKEKSSFSSSFLEVQNNLKSFDNIQLYKGWIPDRFTEVENKTFAFVHIDVDLYQPIFDSLTFFWPKLLPKGIIVIDDYGYSNFGGAKTAVDEFLKENPYTLFYSLPTGSAFILK